MNLLQMSVSGAVFIVAVMVIRTVANRHLPRRTFPVLWGMVLLRLLLPFSIPSVLSIYTFIGRSTVASVFPEAGAYNGLRAAALLWPSQIRVQYRKQYKARYGA